MSQNNLRYSKYHKTIFILSVFVILLIGSLTFKHHIKTNESTQLVMHTYEVGLKLEELFSYVKDSEINIRGFLISKDSNYLIQYELSKININASLVLIKNLTSDSKVQQDNYRDIISIIEKRKENITKYLSTRGTYLDFYDEYFIYRFKENNNLLIKIRKKINLMVNLEKDNLKLRNQKYSNYIYLTPIITLGILLITLLLLILTYIKINNDVETLKKSNLKLSKAQFLSKQAEILSEFGTWEWNLMNNVITYSDNLYNILGIEPQSFNDDKKFSDYVHPDDNTKLEEATNKILNGEGISQFYFRIIDSRGMIKHLRSTGKVFENELAGKTVLGLTEDVTTEFNKTQELSERNKELELNINELNEFNHVASHDLQEPLRKIETFISRLNEKEAKNLTDFGKDYINRILIASNRMRKLINDLLQYSRTSKTEKNYEEINLTTAINHSLVELSQNIEAKKAIIHYAELPTINAIFFQMQQLFTNLIGNSIKYAKKDIRPEINITYDKVIASKEGVLNSSTTNEYHKITISDNGIGFEQENAEKIFLLFNRLHGKTEYGGTGVGLAICKKIIENHNGYIFAQSTANIGTSFIIYLPA